MFIKFCLFSYCFLKFVFFRKCCKYVIVPGVSYGTWNSPFVTFFANKHDYTINKKWRQETTSVMGQSIITFT